MSHSDRMLSSWDLALLDRHQRFYAALASAERQPTTALQAHFVAVALGHSGPATQHEIAFHRFREGWHDPRRGHPRPLAGAACAVAPNPRTERSVDLADAAQLESEKFRTGHAFRRVRDLYVDGKATARRTSADAAVWIATALADARLARSVEGWTSETFGNLSNVYTQAVDGRFVAGLMPGADYVSPWLHRLFEGHTPDAAWRAVRDALPDDTLTEEVVGWLRAVGSDFVTVVGLPITSLAPEDYARIEALVCDSLGISREWLIDALHVNAVEGLQLAAGCVPIIAAAMGWSRSDAETFARLAAGLGVGAVAAANPIMILAALAMLAKAYHMAKAGGGRGLWQPILEGSAPVGAALSIAAMTAGPPLVGVTVGLVVAAGLREALRPQNGFQRPGWMEEPAARIASVVSKLSGFPASARPAL